MRIRRISGLMPPAVVHRVEWYAPEKILGVPPPRPPEPEPPPADWAGHAQHRKIEDDMQGAARQAELLPIEKGDPVQQILASARRAGLSQTEILHLKDHLTNVTREVRAEDIKFLRSTVLRSVQPQRALRSFIEMTRIAATNPGRLSRHVAVTLVAGVAVSGKSEGTGEQKSRAMVQRSKVPEGIKPAEASLAAQALAGMSDDDYKHAVEILDSAEEAADCLNILKAMAARKDALINPAIHDVFRNMTGLPSYFLSEVESYAAEILMKTGEVKPEAIGTSSSAEISPREYLKDGFFTPEHELQSGIYGYCSVAMAHRCRQEGMNSDGLRQIADVLGTLGEQLLEAEGPDPELPLDDEMLSSIQALEEMAVSDAIRDLLSVGRQHMKEFRDLAALAVHIERILQHMPR